ncbi:MAG: sel1 repeat family protein [Nitrospira sp.]|nr:sel1 repeat family protein [Nitrospira sp.]
MYKKGTGVKQDFFQAGEVFRKACLGGVAVGCANLGLMFESGAGVKQSNLDALNYFTKACEMKNEVGCKHYERVKSKK